MIIQLIVTQAFGAEGGIGVYNRYLVQVLADMPEVTEVRVLSSSVDYGEFTIPPKVKFDIRACRGILQFYKKAFGILRQSKPDLIICGHVCFLPISSLLSKCLNVPLAMQLHGVEVWKPARKNFIKNACSKRLKNRISVSGTTLERFESWAGKPEGCRNWILPSSFDGSQFGTGEKPSQLISRYELQDRWVILTFGRLVSEARAKGFDAMLNAMPSIIEKIPNVVYVIAGGGPNAERLQNKAIQLGVDSYVRFTGRVTEEEKKDHFLMADVFAMPSKGEGFGSVLLEAIACGIPVIGSKFDGTKDALMDGQLGQLVDPDSIEEVTNAICNVHSSNLPRTVPAAFVSHYSYDQFAARVREIVLSLTSK